MAASTGYSVTVVGWLPWMGARSSRVQPRDHGSLRGKIKSRKSSPNVGKRDVLVLDRAARDFLNGELANRSRTTTDEAMIRTSAMAAVTL